MKRKELTMQMMKQPINETTPTIVQESDASRTEALRTETLTAGALEAGNVKAFSDWEGFKRGVSSSAEKNRDEGLEKTTCSRCGRVLPIEKFELLKTGTRRRVCNHCRWIYYVKPSRNRSIIREIDTRQTARKQKAKSLWSTRKRKKT